MVAEKQEEPVKDSCSFWQSMGVLKGSAGIYYKALLSLDGSLAHNKHVSTSCVLLSQQPFQNNEILYTEELSHPIFC